MNRFFRFEINKQTPLWGSITSFVMCFVTAVTGAHAQGLSVSVPVSSVEACQDYFTSEWSNPLDMSDSADILYNLVPREGGDLSAFSYDNGIVSMTSTGGDPSLRLLTWVDHDRGALAAIPDDTTRFGVNRPIVGAQSPFYDTLTLRMYTDKASYLQVLYEKQDGSAAFTSPTTTKVGWHTYELNLRNANIQVSNGDYSWESTPITGIRIDPTAISGANIKFDWIQLTPSASRCLRPVVEYNRTGAGYARILVDDDTDPTNGVLFRSSLQSSASGTVEIPTSHIFPGSYKVYGFLAKDYATSISQPWDMDASGSDVKIASLSDISPDSVSFATGQFCATTSGGDPSFLLNIPHDLPIDASQFHKLSLDITVSAPMQVAVYFFGDNSSLKGLTSISIPGSGRYDINLQGVSGWTGEIHDLRIDPGHLASVNFCVDNITLGSSYLPTITAPSLTAPVAFTVKERPLASFVQPDKEGGLDYFVREKGSPSNFDSTLDLAFVSGLSSLQLYPGNVYTDSGGFVRVGDFLEGTNLPGDGDPINGSVLRAPAINPDLYRLVCFDLDVLLPVNVYHSVARVLWLRDGAAVDGDDIVLKTTGEKRYCLRLDTMATEGRAPGSQHPWTFNSNGSGIQYFRVDPHEEEVPTTYRMGDIRLASDHLSNQRFAFVLNGSKNKSVQIYVAPTARSTTGGSLVGTVAGGRASQVLMWDTSQTPEGYYYPYLVVENATYFADAPIRVLRSFNDTTAPILRIDAPSSGYRLVNQMQIAGYALDDVRIATVEVLVDGVLAANIQPTLFNKSVRDAYPTLPYASAAGFNQFLDLSALPDGEHSVGIIAYDTAGNTSEASFSVTKGPNNPTLDITYPVPNEIPIAVPLTNLPNPFDDPGALRVSKAIVDAKGKARVSLNGTGSVNCSIDVSVGRSSAKPGTIIGSYSFSSSKGALAATGVRIHPRTGKVYLIAARKCLHSEYNKTASRALTYKTRVGRIASLKSLSKKLKEGLKITM